MEAAIVVVAVLIVVGALFAWWRHGQRQGRERDDAPPATVPPSTRPKHDTALDELRAMREALKPAEHSRVERRRPGGAGVRVGPERRRGRGTAAAGRASSGNDASGDGGQT